MNKNSNEYPVKLLYLALTLKGTNKQTSLSDFKENFILNDNVSQ